MRCKALDLFRSCLTSSLSERNRPLLRLSGWTSHLERVLFRACRHEHQTGEFFPAHLSYGLIQQSTNEECIVSDLRLRARFANYRRIPLSYPSRRLRSLRESPLAAFALPRPPPVSCTVPLLRESRIHQIVGERASTVSFLQNFLIGAQPWHLFQFAPSRCQIDRTRLDAICGGPASWPPRWYSRPLEGLVRRATFVDHSPLKLSRIYDQAK